MEEYLLPDVLPSGNLCVGDFLSSRAASSQVFSAQVSLTSVFGMGTGGPSPLSTPTILYCYTLLRVYTYLGDPRGNRTPVAGVRGRSLNRLTIGPCGTPSRARTVDTLIKSQVLYQLS